MTRLRLAAAKKGARGPERSQQAADRGAQDEAAAERRADQPELLRALGGRGHVGDVGVGGREGRARDPGERAPEEEPRERRGEAHDQEVDPEGAHGEEQHRAPPEAVAQVAEHGRAQELQRRVREREPAAVDRGLAQALPRELDDQLGHHGHDQPEADRVEQHRDEDEQDRAVHGRRGYRKFSISIRSVSLCSWLAKRIVLPSGETARPAITLHRRRQPAEELRPSARRVEPIDRHLGAIRSAARVVHPVGTGFEADALHAVHHLLLGAVRQLEPEEGRRGVGLRVEEPAVVRGRASEVPPVPGDALGGSARLGDANDVPTVRAILAVVEESAVARPARPTVVKAAVRDAAGSPARGIDRPHVGESVLAARLEHDPSAVRGEARRALMRARPAGELHGVRARGVGQPDLHALTRPRGR